MEKASKDKTDKEKMGFAMGTGKMKKNTSHIGPKKESVIGYVNT